MQIVDSFTVLPPCRTIILAMPKSPWTRRPRNSCCSQEGLGKRKTTQPSPQAQAPASWQPGSSSR